MNQDKELVILHIANLTDDKSKGPNTNVPKNIIYGNKIANVGLYNLQNGRLAINVPKDKYFTANEYGAISDLPAPFNKPDVVVFQGVYFIQYYRISRWLQKNNIPYVIVPRCSMTTAAIKSHALKKYVANVLFFNRFIKNAKAIQFLTENEYRESKRNFKFRDYFVLGNGIELPNRKYEVKHRDAFKIVFVGRYNIYHKGLDILLESVNDNKDWFVENNVTLELYGSDSDNGLAYLSSYIHKNNLKEIIHINGSTFDRKKEEALLDADVFIHTSRLEGQPTSVIEAISYGIPVIVTPGTNVVEEVRKYKLGYTPELNEGSIFDNIRLAFLEKRNLSSVSKNELQYAKKAYDWSTISAEFVNKIIGCKKDNCL